MDPSKENNFEDQWRALFNDASETPPNSVWARVEAHLDEQEDKIVPLIWWRSPKLWFAAASIAAILVTGGVYLNQQYFYASEGISKVIVPTSENETKVASAEGTAVKNTDSLNNRSKTSTEASAIEQADIQPKVEERLASASSQIETNLAKPGRDILARSAEKSKIVSGTIFAKPADVQQQEIASIITGKKIAESENPVATAANTFSVAEQVQQMEAGKSIALLTPSGVEELDVYLQKRYVFFKQQAAKEEKIVKNNKEYYAALSFMPASFNPDLKVSSAPQGFTSSQYSNLRSTSGTSKSGTSYAYQTMGGVKISKHWSVELGLNYLQGNSTYEGGGYLLSATSNGRASNVLESALADATNKNGQVANPNAGGPYYGISNGLNSVYVDVSKDIQNNYRFLQMPLQAGYTLNPEGKLSYGLVGGLMTNFFLKNELESANGYTITTKADDDVYKTVNLAAITGLRFSYRFSPKWRANLTGSYQKALNSTLKSNSSLDSHPYLYGVSWGVRYTF